MHQKKKIETTFLAKFQASATTMLRSFNLFSKNNLDCKISVTIVERLTQGQNDYYSTLYLNAVDNGPACCAAMQHDYTRF